MGLIIFSVTKATHVGNVMQDFKVYILQPESFLWCSVHSLSFQPCSLYSVFLSHLTNPYLLIQHDTESPE